MARSIIILALVAGACHETSQTPLALPTSSPLSEAPTASPEPPMPPPEPAAKKPPAQKLLLEVFTGSKEGFLVNSTLVTGKKDAVLIDAQFTLPDARKVAAAVAASQKNLLLVFVTHSHPDHYFGFPAIKEKFPNARLVALPQTVAMIEKTWEEKLKQWGPLYGAALTTKPIVPEAIAGGSIDLEGQKLEIGPIEQTLIGCPEGSLDTEFARELGAVEAYHVAGDTLSITLELEGGTMRFVRRPGG